MRRRRTLPTGLLVASCAGLLALGALPSAHGGFTGKVTESSNSYGSGAVVLAAAANGSTCQTSTATISTNSNANCAGTLFPAALSGGSASSSDTITNQGNLSAGSAQLVAGSSCGVLTTPDDSSAANNTGILTGNVQLTSTAPFSGSTAMAFDGSSGYLQTETSYDDPTSYSLMAWFKSPSGASGGGSIIGFDNAQSNGDLTEWDRQIFLNASGKLIFALGPAATDELISPDAYNDASWHFVVATESPSGAALYVDGSLVASDSSYTNSLNFAGWWHVGWANSLPWPNPPNQNYFNGDLADVAVFPTALTGSAVSTLYSAPTQADELTDTLADAPSSYWPLSSSSASATGTVDQLGATTPDISGSGNTATVGDGVYASNASEFTGGTSAEFDGSVGYLQTASSVSDPQNFSIAAWFKISAGDVGTVIGFTGSQSTVEPGGYDREIWIDNSGNVVWGVSPVGTGVEIASSSTYDDGAWHFVVASVSGAGMALYVDGVLVASNSSVTNAQDYDGYWHIGWGGENFSGWSDPPSSSYFDGELSNVAIFPSVLTSAQISTLYGESSQAAEQTAMLADGPTYYWPLVSSSTVTFCQQVDATVEDDTTTPTCLLPAGSGACPAPSSSNLLSALAGATLTLPTIAAGASDTVEISLADQSTMYEGMDFTLPLTLSAANGGFTASLQYPAASAAQGFEG